MARRGLAPALAVLVCALAPSSAWAQAAVVGCVTQGGAGVPGLNVHAEREDGTNVQNDDTDGSGCYALSLPDGVYVLREDGAPDIPAEYWPDVNEFDREFAARLVITGGTLTQPGSKDFMVGPGGSLQGTVSGLGAGESAWVEAVDASTNRFRGGAGSDTSTGLYTIGNLPAGSYRVRVRPPSSSDRALRWYHSNAAVNATRFSEAFAIPLAANQDDTGRDVALTPGTSISGTVALPGDPDFANTVQMLWIDALDPATGEWLASDNPDSTGFYEIRNLPPGPCKLRINTQGTAYVSVYWPNNADFSGAGVITAPDTGKGFSLVPGASISGRVFFDVDGDNVFDAGTDLPLANLWVDALLFDVCCGGNGDGTDADGFYEIRGLTPQRYHVGAHPPGNLIDEYWQDTPFAGAAAPVDVTQADATDIDFGIQDGATQGTLRGRVLDPSGAAGVPGVSVRVQRFSDQQDLAWTTSDGAGGFVFGNLPAGEFKVLFDTQGSNLNNNQDLVAEYWTRCQASPQLCDPQTISFDDTKVVYPIPAEAGRALGDFRLVLGGSIEGHVCAAGQPCDGTGLPLPVHVRPESFVSGGPGLPFLPETDANANGSYRIRGLPATVAPDPGQAYRVQADPRDTGSDFVRAYHVNPPPAGPAFNVNQATPVLVNAGANASGKDIYLFPGGSISGTVFCSTGGAGVNVQINVNLQSGPGFGTGTRTGGDGTYIVHGLPAGQYRVNSSVRGPVTCNDNGNFTTPNLANTSVSGQAVSTGQDTGPVNLTLGPAGTISGRVTFDPGSGSEGAVNLRVAAYDFTTGELFGDAFTSGGSDAPQWGFYTIYALPRDRRYEVRVQTRDNPDDPQFANFIEESWDNARAFEDRDPVPGPAPATLGAGVGNINFVLDLGGAISGTVVAEVTSQSLVGASVCANVPGSGISGGCDNTDQNGFYVIRGLPPGSYRVRATPPPPPNDNYVGECYDNAADCALDTRVSVPAATGNTVPQMTGIDFALADGRTIRGRVTFGGNGVAGIPVAARSGSVLVFAVPFTDADGKYTIVGVPPGTYSVTADTLGTAYARERVEGVDVTSSSLPCADTLGRSDCVDLVLEPGGSIGGRVTRKVGGTGVGNIGVVLTDFQTGELYSDFVYTLPTDALGNYTLTGLAAGSYRAETEPLDDLIPAYWQGVYRRDLATPIEIDPGSSDPQKVNKTGVDFEVITGEIVQGRVFFDRDGNGVQDPNPDPGLDEPGIPNLNVRFQSLDGLVGAGARTNADGDYSVRLLPTLDGEPTGTLIQFRVSVNAQGTPYASEFFRQVGGAAKGTFRRSQAGTVTAPRTGVDLSLVLGGSISGTVREGLLPLAGIDVSASAFDGDGLGSGARTGANGQYLLDGLPPAGVEAGYAGTYRVQADDNGQGVYVTELWDNKVFWNEASPLLVNQRSAPDDPLSSVANFDLGRGGTIEGDVTRASDGQPVPGVNVSVQEYDGQQRCCFGSGNFNTSASGHFKIGGIPAGVGLRIFASPPSAGNLVGLYYNGTTSFNAATRVQLSAGENRSDIDFTLAQGGEISGAVRGPNGQLLSGMFVNAQPLTAGLSGRGANTDASGAFTIHGLAAGYYAVNSGGPDPYAFEYYLDKPDNLSANPAQVTQGGMTTGIDFVLTIVPAVTQPVATFTAPAGDSFVPLSIATSPSHLAGGLCETTAPPCSRVVSSSADVTVNPGGTLVGGVFGFSVNVAANAPLGEYSFAIVNDFTYAGGDISALAANVLEVTPGGPPGTTGTRLLVGDQETGSVRVYSVAENAELARIDVAAFPNTIVPSVDASQQPDGRYAYVAGNRAFSVIDLRLGAEVARVPSDGLSGPGAIAATDKYIYAVSRDAGVHNLIRVFDAKTWMPVTTVTVGTNPGGLAIDPQARWLYVANQNSASVSVICVDGNTCGGALHTVLATVNMPAAVQNSPRGSAFLPDGSRAYIVAQRSTYVLDTATRTFIDANGAAPGLGIGTLGGGQGLIGIVTDTSSGKVLAYVGEGGGAVKVVDTATNGLVRTLPSPTLDLFRLRATPERLFLAYGSSKDVYVVPTQGLVAGDPLAFTRIARDTGPTTALFPGALLVVAEPSAPPEPTVGSPSAATAYPNESLTISGTDFDFSEGPPIVWLAGSQTRLEVTGSGPDLNVKVPLDAPAGMFRIAVTNAHALGNDSGLSGPGVTLQVLPKLGYAPTQNVVASGNGRNDVRVFFDDQGDFQPIAGMEAEPAALALTPDGKRGVVQMQYRGAQVRCDALPAQLADMLVFSLEIGNSFREVLPGVRLPYVLGGFESPAVTSNPNGTFVFQPNRFQSDTVSMIDPSVPSEMDTDNNAGTQTYAASSICDDFAIGSKLPGITRIHLDSEPIDLGLGPNEASATPDGNLLYVVNQGPGNVLLSPTTPGSVSLLDTLTRQAKARITKYGPQGNRRDFGLLANVAVSPLGDLVYVSGFDADGLPSLFILKAGVFEDSAASFAGRMTLPFTTELSRGLTVSPDGSRIYVMARIAGNVYVVNRNGTSHTFGPTIALGPGIHGASVAAADNLLYVANGFRDVIHVVDMATNANVANLAGPLALTDLAVQAATGPRVDRVSPATGPLEGGNPVTITGANFLAGATVQLGTNPATSISVPNSFTINATAPAGTGTVDVTVCNVDSQCGTAPNAFAHVGDTTKPVFTTPPYVASESLVDDLVTVEIRWLTDEASNSRVDHGTSASLGSFVSAPAFVTSHLVTLTGLSPATTYYFRATSVDVAVPGNPGESPQSPDAASFTTPSLPDTTPPEITSGPIVSTTHNSAVVQWITNEESSSAVDYDAMIDGTFTSTQTGAPGTSHSVTLNNLPASTPHEYRVRSKDASDNERISGTLGFTTKPVPDAAPPDVLPAGPGENVRVSYLSNDLVIVTWQTDEPSTSFVNYGASSISENGVVDVSLVTTHIVFLTNLQPNTSYGFQIGSSDASGNTFVTGDPFGGGALLSPGTSRLQADRQMGAVTLRAGTLLTEAAATVGFTTPPAPDQTPPAVLSGPAITVLSSDRVLIQASTDEAASLQARYGVGGLTNSLFAPTFTQEPALLLTGLTGGTTYDLTLVFTDPKGNGRTTSGLSFTTQAAPDTTAPSITQVTVSGVTAQSAVVSWTTNEPADSDVRYGRQGQALLGEAGLLGLGTAHSVVLSSLDASTTYALEVRSRDASGNLGTAAGTTFTTSAVPPTLTSLAPSLLAQGASTVVGLNGQHFEAGATVDFGAGITVGSVFVNGPGTRVDADVTVAGNAAIGVRGILVTNPASGLTATAAFTIVDETAPTVTIDQPGAEVVTTNVTVLGTLSEPATVTVNGVPATANGLAFSAGLTLVPGANTITATATDPAGNVGSATSNVKVMQVSLSNAAPVGESGGAAAFTLTLSAASAGPIGVSYLPANGTAQAPADYDGSPGSVVIPANTTSYPLLVAVQDDAADEPDERFTVSLTSATGAAIVGGPGSATILDNDAPPSVSVADAGSFNEGNSGTKNATFLVSLSQASGFTVTVDYQTQNGSAQAGSDFVAATSSVSFSPGETSKPVNVTVNGDTSFESDETFFLKLTGAVNATLGDAQGAATILNDDPAGPTLSISDATVPEQAGITTQAAFTVTLSAPQGQTVTVAYATANGSATAASGDYTAASGTLSFAPGVTSRTVSVNVNGDTLLEGDEAFFVNLGNPSLGTLGDGQGQATIREVSLAIDDVSVAEGDGGTRSASFTVRLSLAGTKDVTFSYATANGTATAPGDYKAKSGTLTIPAGATSATIAVTVNGDQIFEPGETFFLNLTNPKKGVIADGQGQGTIVNDDPDGPAFSISDATVPEHAGGTTQATFTVTLSAPRGQTVTVAYATADGSATAASGDYTAASGTLSFAPGVISKTLSVDVNGDVLLEGNETFFVNLSNPNPGTLGDSQGQSTIREVTLTIDDASVSEGNSGTRNVSFTVHLSYAGTKDVTFSYATANGTATAPGDYKAKSGTLTIRAGATSATIAVTVNGDQIFELSETFFLNLTNPKKAVIADGQGQGTIVNDDP